MPCPICGSNNWDIHDGGEAANYEAEIWFCEDCEYEAQTCEWCQGTGQTEDDNGEWEMCIGCEGSGMVGV
jgi:hypothetical protein